MKKIGMRKLVFAGFISCLLGSGVLARHYLATIAPVDEADQEAATEPDDKGGDRSDYWITRNTYPTGNFDPQWVLDAAQQERQMVAAVPGGLKTYSQKAAANSPLALDAGHFVPLGPMPENNTQQSFNHVSGRVNVIKVDPTNTTPGSITVYAGTDGGGIWKTTNCCTANTTWQITTDVPEVSGMSISDLVIDPNNHDIVYAGTGDLNFGSFSFGASGVLKSADGGDTWQLLGADIFSPYYPSPGNPNTNVPFPQYQAVGKVAVDPNHSNIVFAGTKTSLYVSYDAGNNWSGPCYTNQYALPNNAVSTSAQRQDVTGLIPVSNGDGTTRLYVAIGTRGSPTPVQVDLGLTGSNGVYVAQVPSSGCPAIASWTLLNTGWPAGLGNGVAGATPLGRIEIAVAPSNPQRMYAEAEDTGSKKINSFYVSNDAGSTWTQTSTSVGGVPGFNNNGTNPGCEGNSNNGGAQMWYDAGLTVDPNNPDRVWMSTIDATVSSDGGKNYYDVTCGYGNHTTTGNVGQALHVDHHARAFVGNDSTQFLLGSDGGAYYTANADAPVTASNTKNTMSFIALNDKINSIEFYFGDITSNFATSPLPAIGAGAQDNGCSRASFSGQPVGPVLWNSNCSGDGTTTKIEPVHAGYWFNSSQYGSLARGGTAAAPYYNTATGAFTGNVSTSASASTGGTWGGDPANVIFAMSYNIYKWGVLDAPNSGCTSANGCNHMIAGTTRLWETVDMVTPTNSTNLRASWKARTWDLTKGTLNLNLTGAVDIRSYINYVDYSFTDPTVAAVATNDGNVQLVFGLGSAVSANCPTAAPVPPNAPDPNCATPVNVTDSNTILPNRPIFGVRFDPTTALVAYAAVGGFNANTPTTPGHLFQITCSDYNCPTFTWKDKTGNLPDVPAEQVMPNPNLPQQVFVGTDWGLYFTDDITQDSPTWYRMEDFPHVMVWELVVDRGFTTLAAFTRARGAWAWPLSNSSIGTLQTDLAVTNAGPASVVAGNNVSYTLTVTNNGPNAAPNVQLSDPAPAGLSFVSVSGDCPDNVLPCHYGELASGQMKQVTVTFAVSPGYDTTKTISNVATVAGSGTDPISANNSATAVTTVSSSIDLAVDVSGPTNVARGTNVVYTITVSNNGPSTAHNVSVADATPSGLVFVSNSGDCTTAFPCSFASLAPGVQKQITATFSVPVTYSDVDPIANTATVAADENDSSTANNTDTVDTALADSADLSITQSGALVVQAGHSVSYTLTIANAGPSAASNVSVDDLVPPGLTNRQVGGGTCSDLPCSAGTLAPGDGFTVTVSFDVPADYAGNQITHAASVSSDTVDPELSNNVSAANTTVGVGADIVLSASAPSTVVLGGVMSYSLTVTNNGPSTANGVSLDASLAPGLVFASNGGDCTGAFPCALGTLQPGEAKTVTTTVCVPANYQGSYLISSSATATTTSPDPFTGNNSALAYTSLLFDALFVNGFETCP
jgi:uncharacterized repeat protein (TIGR01451 family)